jgi:hypothetical protein
MVKLVEIEWFRALNSFALDFVARQKTPGIHLNVTAFSQLPVPLPQFDNPLCKVAVDRALELSYVTSSLTQFAHDCGYDGPPFSWDEKRRFELRCELDAASSLGVG